MVEGGGDYGGNFGGWGCCYRGGRVDLEESVSDCKNVLMYNFVCYDEGGGCGVEGFGVVILIVLVLLTVANVYFFTSLDFPCSYDGATKNV